jgi:outer membrane protein assembly factor BamB
MPALIYAEPVATSAEDWQYTNSNSWAWSYSPQTQINRDNVDQLEVKWIFPLAPRASAPAAIQSLAMNEGTQTPPLVVDGKVFVTTNYLRTHAVDALTGRQLWTHNYVIDVADVKDRLPLLIGPEGGFLAILNAHLHGITYWDAGNSLLINGMACDFYGVDADTGETNFWVQDLCLDVPGNLYKYRQGTAVTDGVATYDEGNQFIFVIPGAMHSNAFTGDARHVMMGVDMDTHEILWRVFNFPPQDVPTKDWALQDCNTGFFRDIPCSDVAAAAPENLEWDWAEPGETPSVFGGVTANWGATPVIDEDSGILYTNTGNQGPFTYIGATPGPRLYGSTIMAIDMNQGTRIWWNQPMPRDPYDYDCNWDGILADVPGLGKVYMKGCKEGLLQVLDAATGEPKYMVDVIDEQISWGQITSAAANEPFEGGIKYHQMDPFSYYDMREMLAPENSNYCGAPCPIYPMWLNGIFATDMAYDPETATLFHFAMALQTWLVESPPPAEEGSSMSITRGVPEVNTTIVARDVATGEVKWTWYYDVGFVRAHIVVTPELVFTGFPDGFARFLDKDTGEVLREMNLGASQLIGYTTGQDSAGDQKIFTISGIGTTAFEGIFPSLPGTLIAIGLSERAAEEVRTTTVTSTTATTLTTTTATTSIVTSATTSTVTSSTTSTVTSATTSTVTSEITEETGLPAEITYAAVAVAVIAIIAAVVLMMRRR